VNKIRIGLIGLGGVANAHLAAIRRLETVQLVCVCDVRAEQAQRVAADFSARPYTHYRDLLKAGGIDLVMVLTPASTHRAIVEAGAARGVHVFCEKPLAVAVSDGHAMIEACATAGVKLFYGSCYRYLPAVRKARELILSGAIGKIQLMTEQVIGGTGIEGYRQLGPIHYPIGGPGGGGISLMDHGIHLIDIFSWFAGSAPVRAIGSVQIAGSAAQTEFLVMSFPGGASGYLLYNAATYSASLPNEGMFSGGEGWMLDDSIAPAGDWVNEPGSMSIYGTTGSLRVFHYTNALFLNTGGGTTRVELTGRPSLGHFQTQLEDCVSAITENRAPSVRGADGLSALTTVLSAFNSAPVS
jgi:UDP-N-acetyl-2-amino-2-deoxyglucuronate dehydrogenase